ncbi:MAG: TnpV protein [Clostridium sp.]|jgi:hypothetical protein|nr:TnpV protein [Clostridium sp.]
MTTKSLFEQMGGYRQEGDCFIPNLTLPEEPACEIGRFGLMRRHYLKNHRKALFSRLLMAGELHKHFYEIDQAANDWFWLITNQMAKSEGVTEELKSKNQLLWIQKMTNIRNRVEEIILDELIYN